MAYLYVGLVFGTATSAVDGFILPSHLQHTQWCVSLAVLSRSTPLSHPAMLASFTTTALFVQAALSNFVFRGRILQTALSNFSTHDRIDTGGCRQARPQGARAALLQIHRSPQGTVSYTRRCIP